MLLRGDMDALPMTEETGLPFASTIPARCTPAATTRTPRCCSARRRRCARRRTRSGTIVFMFQPGEEGHHGAKHMIADGLLDIAKPEAAFALHISPNAPAGVFVSREGPLLASTDTVLATIRGKGGHAAMPHDALDPIPVACAIVTALQQHVARRVPVADPAVLTITQIHAGSSRSIIPDEVKIMDAAHAVGGDAHAHARRLRPDRGGDRRRARLHRGLFAGGRLPGDDERSARDEVDARIAGELSGERGWSVMPAPMMGARTSATSCARSPARWPSSASPRRAATRAPTHRSTTPA
ncbi:M20 metallopeptidase family protein [Sphingomonas sp. MMS24-JH45]